MSLIFVATKVKYFPAKSVVATRLLLSRQTRVAIKQVFCLDKSIQKCFSRQAYFCRDKGFSRRNYVCRDKKIIIAESYFCLEKRRVATNVKYLSRQTCCRDMVTFVATNTFLSQQKMSLVGTKVCKSVCHDKVSFVATNTCLTQRNKSFVATKVYKSVCRYKHTFVATKVRRIILLSRQKTCFVTINTYLSRQNIFSRQKWYLCYDKHVFVATKHFFSRQKWYLWQLPPVIGVEVAGG